jgi:hypothetical protein
MLSLWFDVSMLALESLSVVALRVGKIAAGGAQSADEIALMIHEKIAAGAEAVIGLMSGVTATATINRYRDHVAVNQMRLSPAPAQKA